MTVQFIWIHLCVAVASLFVLVAVGPWIWSFFRYHTRAIWTDIRDTIGMAKRYADLRGDDDET